MDEDQAELEENLESACGQLGNPQPQLSYPQSSPKGLKGSTFPCAPGGVPGVVATPSMAHREGLHLEMPHAETQHPATPGGPSARKSLRKAPLSAPKPLSEL